MSRRIQALLEPYFSLNDKWFIRRRQVQKVVQHVAERARISQEVTPHVLRHYLPFRTMSCNGDPPRIWIANFRSRRAKPPDIARHSLVPSTGSSGRQGVDRWNPDQRISLLTRWPCKPSDMRWKRAFQSPRQNYLVINNTLHGGLLSPAWSSWKESILCRCRFTHCAENTRPACWY